MFGWGDFGGEKMGGGGVFSLGSPLFYTPKLEKYVGERGGIYGNYHSTPLFVNNCLYPYLLSPSSHFSPQPNK